MLKRLKEHQMCNLSISTIANVGHGETKMEDRHSLNEASGLAA